MLSPLVVDTLLAITMGYGFATNTLASISDWVLLSLDDSYFIVIAVYSGCLQGCPLIEVFGFKHVGAAAGFFFKILGGHTLHV